ncbi:MAG: PEP-CTERM sorting domain-containing protein [Opitutaceae bacterium]
MNKKTLALFGSAVLAASSTSSAAVLVQYNFDNDATHLDADVLHANLTETGPTSPDFSLAVTSESNLFAAEGQGVEDGITDNMAAAWSSGQYWEFTVNADGLNTFSLETLTFDISRAIRGTNDYAIRTSVDSFASNLVYQNQSTSETVAAQTVSFDLPTDFSGLSGTSVDTIADPLGTYTAGQFDGLSTITFRIAIDDRESNNGGASATRLDNIVLNGTVVPEPSTYALLAGCFALTSVMLRRRRA